MFDFLKKKESSIDDIDIDEDIVDIGDNENILEDKNSLSDIDRLLDSLEYTNSYIAQLNITLAELTKQQTIANALNILDSEYKNADKIMKIDEILAKRRALYGEIFIDYQVKQEEEDSDIEG